MPRQLLVLARLLALTLVTAACGAGPAPVAIGEPVPTTPSSSTATDVPPPASGATTSVPAEPRGPIAPDFTLALGDGGVFTLSEGEKPVYMVFWAEW
jgi:hypothetical protein